jgi:hypothetical protein
MRFPSFLALLAVCAGCGTAGQLAVTKSDLNQAEQISFEPAWVDHGLASSFRIGAHRNSKMPPGDVVLTVLTRGGKLIADGPSLKFSINGTITILTSIDETTRIESGYSDVWGSKRYEVKVDFLHALVESSNVMCRLELDRSFVEGVVSTDNPTTLRPALRRFLKAIDGKK